MEAVRVGGGALHVAPGLASSEPRHNLAAGRNVERLGGNLLDVKRFQRTAVAAFKGQRGSPLHNSAFASESLLFLSTSGRVHVTRSAASPVANSNGFLVDPPNADDELYQVLDLATSEELREVSDILYGQSLLSPLVKSLAVGDGSRNEPITEALHEGTVEGREEARETLLRRLETRFLFLAADSRAVLRGRRPTYRVVLLAVRSKLQVPCSARLATPDLEAEIFLHLLQDYSRTEEGPSPNRKAAKKVAVNSPEQARVGGLRGAVMAAFRMGGEELLSTVVKGGSALTMSTLEGLVVRKLTGKVLLERAKYQVAREVLVKGGQVVATKLETQLALLTARQGLAGAAARYVSLRSMMTFLGPLMWGTFLADVVIQAVGTDYARVVRAIYAFAQIRLTRTYGWTRTDSGP